MTSRRKLTYSFSSRLQIVAAATFASITRQTFTHAFGSLSPFHQRSVFARPLHAVTPRGDDVVEVEGSASSSSIVSSRSDFLRRTTTTAAAVVVLPLALGCSFPPPACALVKGNAPPPPRSKSASSSVKKTCTNVEECQEQAERTASEEARRAAEEAAASPVSVAPRGSRYKDTVVPSDAGDSAVVRADVGDVVDVHYRVLKLGKRSYDGLGGEGTVVFSRGYGLEDDETAAGTETFRFTIGDPDVIAALNDALPGAPVGGTRRISVAPQMGWEKPGVQCDGGPGGRGTGGDLRTDYVVVPTATMVAEEACMDKTKRPFPKSYAQQRRMAQRFDQSLIMEVELVGVTKK